MAVVFNGKTYKSDSGYLINPGEWDETLAEFLAEKEKIVLKDAHWEIIRFLRDYYQTYEAAPMLKVFIRILAEKMGMEKNPTAKIFFDLFPQGLHKQAWKIAGLPKQSSCY